MIKLIHGEALEEMQKLIDQGVKVDAIITDPPYGTIKGMALKGQEVNTWDTKTDTKIMFQMFNKLLNVNGRVVLFSQEPYTSELRTLNEYGIAFSQSLIWKKNHFANNLLSKKACVSYFEDITVFTKVFDTEQTDPLREYFKDLWEFMALDNKKQLFEIMGNERACHVFRFNSAQFKLCKEDVYNQLISKFNIDKYPFFKRYDELQKQKNRNVVFNLPYGEKIRSNIFEFAKENKSVHPTQKPVDLMGELIKTYTNEGDTVLDFTMGSGSTGVACKALKRNFIGIELDEKYFKIAQERIKND